MSDKSSDKVLEMRRPGRPADGEKLYHFHQWGLVEQGVDSITFACVRCGDKQKLKALVKLDPEWVPWSEVYG